MTPIEALALGTLEGLTEFLPVSSTGHLILAQAILSVSKTPFLTFFDIIIQVAAIMAVLGIYMRYIIAHPSVIVKSIIAFIPTGFVGFLFYPLIKNVLLGNELLTISALALGGALLIAFDKNGKTQTAKPLQTIETLPIGRLLWIGLIQSLSIIPGVSRAAATIIGGLTAGLSREEAVRFSFLLAAPTIAAAAGFDLVKNYHLVNSSHAVVLIIGLASSFAAAWVAVRFFVAFVEKHTLTMFGVYRIVLALAFLLFFQTDILR